MGLAIGQTRGEEGNKYASRYAVDYAYHLAGPNHCRHGPCHGAPCPFYGRRVDRIRSVHPCSCPCEHLFLETTSAAPRHSRFLSSLRHFSPVSASRSVTIIHTRSRLSVLLLAPLSSLSPFLRRPLFWVDIILIAATLPITVRLYPAGCRCLDMLRNIGDITWVSHRKVGRVSDWNEIWTWESVKRPGGNLRGLSHLCHG